MPRCPSACLPIYWTIAPPLWWFVELGVIAACGWYYWQQSKVDRTYGGWALAIVAVIVFLHIVNSPWLSTV